VEYDFTWWGLVGGIVLMAIALVIAGAVVVSIFWDKESKPRLEPGKHGLAVAGALIGVFAVSLAGLNLLSYWFTHYHNDPSQTYPEVAAVIGLESGKNYPARFGNPLASSPPEGGFVIGPIVATGIESSPVAVVSYTYNGRTDIFEVPVNYIRPKPGKAAQPQMRLILKNTSYGDKVSDTVGECRRVIRGLVLTCQRVITFKVSVSDEDMRKGVVPIINSYLKRAVILIPPQDATAPASAYRGLPKGK
jgi:hypothetical protein